MLSSGTTLIVGATEALAVLHDGPVQSLLASILYNNIIQKTLIKMLLKITAANIPGAK